MKDLFEKLNTLKKLFISSLTYSKNIEHKKLFSKVVRTYFSECILKGKDEFSLCFNGIYIESFIKRFIDYILFVHDIIYRFFLMHFVTKSVRNKLTKNFHNYELVNFGIPIPIHSKVTNTPNEFALEDFLEKNGFEITDELLYAVRTIYKIKRI